MPSFVEIIVTVLSLLTATILINVLQQTLLQSSYEPPLVFHWVPVIGNTVSYGIDPFKFFFDCKAKVRQQSLPLAFPDLYLLFIS